MAITFSRNISENPLFLVIYLLCLNLPHIAYNMLRSFFYLQSSSLISCYCRSRFKVYALFWLFSQGHKSHEMLLTQFLNVRKNEKVTKWSSIFLLYSSLGYHLESQISNLSTKRPINYAVNMTIVYMHQKYNYPYAKSIMSQPVLYRNRAMFWIPFKMAEESAPCFQAALIVHVQYVRKTTLAHHIEILMNRPIINI